MKNKIIYVTTLFLFLSFTAICFGTPTPIDIQIKNALRDLPGNITGYGGGAVVNTNTGELMGSYVMDSRLAEQKHSMGAVVTNIVREVHRATGNFDFQPKWMAIKLKNNQGKLFILFLSNDTFVGCMYSNDAPVGMVKRQLKKLKRELNSIL